GGKIRIRLLQAGDGQYALTREVSRGGRVVRIGTQDRVRNGAGKERLPGTAVLSRTRRTKPPGGGAPQCELLDRCEFDTELRARSAAGQVIVVVTHGRVGFELLCERGVK